MRIEPRIAERHWEAAAAEQVAERLRAEGYTVRRDAKFADLRVDLVARKGQHTVVYEFKSPSEGGREWGRAVSRLRERAVERGARFRIVFVRPPREARIEVEGIESALEEALRKHFPATLAELSGATTIEDVSDVQIDVVEVRRHETALQGQATVAVSWDSGDDPRARESFPFSFDVALDRGGHLKAVSALDVDTSSWLGDGADISRASDALGTRDAGNEADPDDL